LGTDIHNPDFVQFAQAFGARGVRATDPEQLRRALRESFETAGPTIIDVPVEF